MNKIHQGLVLCCALLYPGLAGAQTQYYQCKDRWGQAVFSEKPCGDDAKKGSIREANNGTQNATSQRPDAASAAANPDRAWDRISASNRLREIERETRKREQKVATYQAERDQQVAALQEQRKMAANNLAGATWEKSLASEMRAVVQQYNSRINSEQQKLDRLHREAETLRGDL